MNMEPSDTLTIRSRDWRSAWIGRIIVLLVAIFAIFDTYVFFGWPWKDSFVLVPLGVDALFLAVLAIAIESIRPRSVSVSQEGVIFEYLYNKRSVPWTKLRRSSTFPIPSVKAVAYEQLPNPGLGGRRYHWVTVEQSRAILRYAPWKE